MIKLFGRIFLFLEKCIVYVIKEYQKTLFKKINKNSVYIGDNCYFTYKNITIGESVYIGRECLFSSVHGDIIIGNHVMFGPRVSIHGGNHIYDRTGVYMDQNDEKKFGVDGKVVINDDCWIGANSIILKGVELGEGCIVAAGSIVTKSVPPYSIVGGNPAKIIKMRFSKQEIAMHKKILKDRGKE